LTLLEMKANTDPLISRFHRLRMVHTHSNTANDRNNRRPTYT